MGKEEPGRQTEKTGAPGAPQEPCERPVPKAPAPDITDFPSHFARLFFATLILLILYFSYLIVKPYLIEIFLALVLFFTSKPLYNLLVRLFRGHRGLASGTACLLLAVFIILPILLLTGVIAAQALDLYNTVEKGLQSGYLWQALTEKFAVFKEYLASKNLPIQLDQFNLESMVRSVLTRASQFVYTSSVGLLKGFTSFIFSLLLILFVTFFLFLSGDDFIAEIKRLSPLDATHNEEILGDVETTIKATLKGTVIVAIIQGALGGAGFWVFGVPKAAFWGTVMIPASVIPVVGAMLIWAPAALYLYFVGHSAAALGLTLWCALGVGSVDNLVKPFLMKGARYTPPIFILFSIMGGLEYFGLVGFILGPLILSFLLSLLSIYQNTVLRQGASLLPASEGKPPGPPPAAVLPEKEKPPGPEGPGA